MDKNTIERLTYIKYLYLNAEAYSKIPTKLSAYSILTFYDIVETFLILIAEVKKKRILGQELSEYWNDKHDLKLEYQNDIDKLRLHRKNLKHKGTLPHSDDIIICRKITIDFLISTMKSQFNLDWESISLSMLIEDKEIGGHILEAENLSTVNNFVDSIEQSAIAFHKILEIYNKRTIDFHNRLKFPFNYGRFSSFPVDKYDRHLNKFIGETNDILDKTITYLRLSASGLNMSRYMRFAQITPSIFKTSSREGSGYMSQGYGYRGIPIFDQEESHFCIDFVIESYFVISSIANYELKYPYKAEGDINPIPPWNRN